MRILVIADSDLDGTGSATIVTKYHELFTERSWKSFFRSKPRDTVYASFPDRLWLNTKFEDPVWVRKCVEYYDLIYICDIGVSTEKANKNLGQIMAPKVVYFDHHSTTLDKQSSYIDNYKSFNVIEGSRCSANIAYDILHEQLIELNREDLVGRFKKLYSFSFLVNDLDMWHRTVKRSTELGDYVASVGARPAYETLLSVCEAPYKNIGNMSDTLQKVASQKEHSLSLAKATLVKHKGYKTPFHTCIVNDWASWVAGELCPKTGMLGMFDVKKASLSFRVGPNYIGDLWHSAKEPKPNCLDFAERLGGGGHPQAAGAGIGCLAPSLKHFSSQVGELLLEIHNGRKSGDTADRKVGRTNTNSRKSRTKRS